MTDYKIGDKVRLKGQSEFLGYVSHVHKGHLFSLGDQGILVHIGNGQHVNSTVSEIERFDDEN